MAFACARDDFEVEAPVSFVLVEMAPVGAEVDVGFEAGEETLYGFDGTGGTVLYLMDQNLRIGVSDEQKRSLRSEYMSNRYG